MKTRYIFGLPFVTITVQNQEIEALLDTGFDGWLMLPDALIQGMSLQFIGCTEYELADGEIVESSLYEAEVEWLGEKRKFSVVSTPSDLSLVGMALLSTAKTILRPSKNILQIERDE